MGDLSIRPEAVEAAAKAMGRDDEDSFGSAYYEAQADVAIAAFCEAEGLTVERDLPVEEMGDSQLSPIPTRQRLVGPWRDCAEEER